MYEIAPLARKAKRFYDSGAFHRAILNGAPVFPLRYPFGKLSEKRIVASFDMVRKAIEALASLGSLIRYREVRFRTLGVQRLPEALVFEDQGSYLHFLGEKARFSAFMEAFKEAETLGLGPLLRDRPKLLMDHLSSWSQIAAVLHFFLAHPKPGIYIRELPIEGVDTKFIQRHRKILDTFLCEILPPEAYDATIARLSDQGFERKYGLRTARPRLRFRLLDDTIAGLNDLEIPIDAFNRLTFDIATLYIVENLMTFLAFPTIPDAMVIYGGGFKAVQLQEADLSFAKRIRYWGDLDTHGFAILSALRSAQPNIESFLMDKETLERFAHLCVEEPSPAADTLPHLRDGEREVYDLLRSGAFAGRRLEQERIPLVWVERRLHD